MRKLIFVLLCLAGCSPTRYYSLPVSPEAARSTIAPIAAAAASLGYHAHQSDDRVTFEPDTHSRIDFMIEAGGSLSMCVTLNDNKPASERDAAFAAVKTIGDNVWNRAISEHQPVANAPAAGPPPPPEANAHNANMPKLR
jgi:hypothetical protein